MTSRPPSAKTSRREKLAAALRANLKRRKEAERKIAANTRDQAKTPKP